MAANAGLLDQLMGAARNANPGEKVRKKHWSDESVCKYFLCGFCPSELFTNTRSDVGPCEKIHDPELKTLYEESKERYSKGYEEMFQVYLEDIINQLDKRIERGYARLRRSASAKAEKLVDNVEDDVRQKIDELSQSINDNLAQIELLGAEGNVDQAQELMAEVERQEKERGSFSNRPASRLIAGFEANDDFHVKMEVCDVCGSFLVIGDTQSRVDSHLLGKQHLGYARIRAAIVEMKNSREERKMKLREENLKRRESESRGRHGHKSSSSRSSRSRSPPRDHKSHKRERTKREDRSRSRERRRSRDRSPHHHRRHSHRSRSPDHRRR